MNMYETFASQCNMLLRANTEACKRIELLKDAGVIMDSNVRIGCYASTMLVLEYVGSQGFAQRKPIIDAKQITTWDEKEVLDHAVGMLGELIKDNMVRVIMHIREEVNNAKV